MSALMQIHQNRHTLEHDGKIPAGKSVSQCAYQNAQRDLNCRPEDTRGGGLIDPVISYTRGEMMVRVASPHQAEIF